MIPHGRINRIRKNLQTLNLLIRIPDPAYQTKALQLLTVIRRQFSEIDLLNQGRAIQEAHAPEPPSRVEDED